MEAQELTAEFRIYCEWGIWIFERDAGSYRDEQGEGARRWMACAEQNRFQSKTIVTTCRSYSISSSQSKDQVESRLLLDVVIGESSTILELLSGENESLLVWRDSLLVLDLRLDVVDRVGGLDLESDRLSGKGCRNKSQIETQNRNQVEYSLLTKICIPPRSRRTR